MDATVVCLAGGIASGKTTLAALLAERLGTRVTSFGEFVRVEARSRGLGEDRQSLQAVGAELVATGMMSFCQQVLRAADWEPGRSIVVEGIRHTEAFECVRAIVAPVPARLVLIDVDRFSRAGRLRMSGRGDNRLLSEVERHSTEAQVGSCLRDLADLVVDGTPEPAHVLEALINGLSLGSRR